MVCWQVGCRLWGWKKSPSMWGLEPWGGQLCRVLTPCGPEQVGSVVWSPVRSWPGRVPGSEAGAAESDGVGVVCI